MAASPDSFICLPSRNVKPSARYRMFLLPSAGSPFTVFFPWSKEMQPDPDWELRVLSLPGRGSRSQQPSLTTVDGIVDEIMRTSLPLFEGKPFVFFGHSFGGLLAYELAVRLRALGKPGPVHIFIASQAPPSYAHKDLGRSSMSDAEAAEMLRNTSNTPAEVLDNPQMLSMVLPPLRADWAAEEQFVPSNQEPLDIPFSILWGKNDLPEVLSHSEAWAPYSTKPLVTKVYEGNHFWVMDNMKECLSMMRSSIPS
eukprot:NODE_3532_length_959_cov_34.512088_g3243_i0.p1 GENE.NODE_3532_length_959_cov_34.512088_g3243_i0~~NODE_3532_length_959_cov_34.512088_g3243_i0.p1  ORF type:complete len:254 (-),score=40.08 NODE_3532_length_959_cov_34.512088_g3243_i0:123-884(-)